MEKFGKIINMRELKVEYRHGLYRRKENDCTWGGYWDNEAKEDELEALGTILLSLIVCLPQLTLKSYFSEMHFLESLKILIKISIQQGFGNFF